MTVSRSRSRAPRLMMLPARRAALTAVVSMGCMGFAWRVVGRFRRRVGAGRRRVSKSADSGYFTRFHAAAAPRLPWILPLPPLPHSSACASCSCARRIPATSAPPRARCTRWASTRLVLVDPKRFPDPEATALATGATVVLDGARVVATLADALAGCALAVGLSARPRAFAGRVLAMRDAAREAIRHTDARRRRARVRHRDVGPVQRGARAVRHRGDDSGQSRLRVAQRRVGRAGRRVRSARRGGRAARVVGAALPRRRRTTRSRPSTRTRGAR